MIPPANFVGIAQEEALKRQELEQKLFISEQRYAGLLARAPIGLAMMDPEGDVLSANGMIYLYYFTSLVCFLC